MNWLATICSPIISYMIPQISMDYKLYQLLQIKFEFFFNKKKSIKPKQIVV